MFKKIFSFLVIVQFFHLISFAQIPAGYYDVANGLTGLTLKTALYNKIKGHTVVSYGGLYNSYQTTDNLPPNKVWDMYSIKADGTANYFFSHTSGDQCGSYSSEGDCYNREHSTPASWFNDASPMYSDLFNVYPTDGYVNNRRSNYPQANVGSVTWTSSNGSKVGTCNVAGYTGVVFEPIDSFKGDFARTFLYMATRYENLVANWPSNSPQCAAVYAGNNGLTFKPWYITMLLSWCALDPVSQKEINRNNAVYAIQNNRNPYIDHPEYINLIWGGSPNIMVTSISVTGQGGSSSISTQNGTLQMLASVLPANATNSTYTWSVKNPTVGTISSTGLLTAISNGIDTVLATANDGSGIVGFKVITISNQGTGVNFANQSQNINLYPNPADNEIFIDFNSLKITPESIFVSDTRGRKIINFTNISELQRIDISNLEKGLYFVTISYEGQYLTYKFVK